MEFRSAAQKACYEKIVPWMKELFGEFVMLRTDAPAMAVVIGSAVAQVGVIPWGNDDATINTRAYVVTGAEATSELMHFLLRETDNMRFGGFGLDSDDDVFFEHAIVGSTCDKPELKASVMAVVVTADQYDDKIIARWGGQRALDRMS
ncbi:YbjN domain-containing protein [Candidatus Amarolinea dominans]|uniref:T3SS (YopN, CesT) and YbjN peptide-binding chaperone 1 n=1 Tax=Candidatus Amarolinea dominans TaxID=3140696 RepID=UPI001D343019|nr:YbjN domain-containing protein [Anaerolineae bacterium]MBK9095404.1 YbjN domain-containing protein [Anaerolineae bacterium]MBK9233395.1 YbjN domain-containing protein [Anaerolineae bacterium]